MRGVRKAFASKGDDSTLCRFVKVPEEDRVRVRKPRQQWLPNLRHKVLEMGRSIFYRKQVKHPSEVKNLLVSGHSNVKIGRDVRKGKLKGYWIYTLSLEERATCPTSCKHWQDCYGNNMPWAKRIAHGPEMLEKLAEEIPRLLNVRGRKGILIRLHALGDFYSPHYVAFWTNMLATHPRLSVYGYTAWPPESLIGATIKMAKESFGDRFAIRWSDGGRPTGCTVSIERATDKPFNAFLCPEQTAATLACATCALCWATDKNVAFLTH